MDRSEHVAHIRHRLTTVECSTYPNFRARLYVFFSSSPSPVFFPFRQEKRKRKENM